MIDFSVIIPVYNASRFLRDCLDSVLASIQVSNIEAEIICIDDGSTDESGEILDQYARTDRIIVRHQRNNGVSVARNVGLGLAKGRYVCFVDADDTVTSEWLSEYVKVVVREQDPDLIRLNFGGNCAYQKMSGEDAWLWTWRTWVQNGYVWTYAIKREIAIRAQFPVGVCCCEDSIYEMQLTPYVRTVVQISKSFYDYRDVPGSASRRSHSSAERVLAMRALCRIADSGMRLDSVTFARAIWGNMSIWACGPRDVTYRREIYDVFRLLRARGLAPLSVLRPRILLPSCLYDITGWIWPMRVYDRVIVCLSKVKRMINLIALKGDRC